MKRTKKSQSRSQPTKRAPVPTAIRITSAPSAATKMPISRPASRKHPTRNPLRNASLLKTKQRPAHCPRRKKGSSAWNRGTISRSNRPDQAAKGMHSMPMQPMLTHPVPMHSMLMHSECFHCQRAILIYFIAIARGPLHLHASVQTAVPSSPSSHRALTQESCLGAF